MPALPVVPSFEIGVVSPTEMNRLAIVMSFLMTPPLFQGRATVVQLIPNGFFTAVNYDVEQFDSAAGADLTLDPSRYYAPYPGIYELSGGVGWAGSVTGNRGLRWYVNGAGVDGSQVMVPAAGAANPSATPARTVLVRLALDDYVELWAYQSTGVGLNTSIAAGEQSTMTVKWVSA